MVRHDLQKNDPHSATVRMSNSLSFRPRIRFRFVASNWKSGRVREVNATWLRLPHRGMEILSQHYTQLDSYRYLNQTRAGFSADLLVDDLGWIALYPRGWKRVRKPLAAKSESIGGALPVNPRNSRTSSS